MVVFRHDKLYVSASVENYMSGACETMRYHFCEMQGVMREMAWVNKRVARFPWQYWEILLGVNESLQCYIFWWILFYFQ
jgi:hypothetical protein